MRKRIQLKLKKKRQKYTPHANKQNTGIRLHTQINTNVHTQQSCWKNSRQTRCHKCRALTWVLQVVGCVKELTAFTQYSRRGYTVTWVDLSGLSSTRQTHKHRPYLRMNRHFTEMNAQSSDFLSISGFRENLWEIPLPCFGLNKVSKRSRVKRGRLPATFYTFF